MKFSGKICLKIISKVTKNQGFFLSFEDRLFEKTQGGGQLDPPPAVLGLRERETNMNKLWTSYTYLCC